MKTASCPEGGALYTKGGVAIYSNYGDLYCMWLMLQVDHIKREK